MAFTNAQLQQLWIQNGGRPAAAPMAAAIALAESSGDPNNTNHNTNGTTDRGLWQVNSIWGGLSTYDITANTRAAIHISKNGTNWGPWSTFNNGAYRKFLGGAQTAPVPADPGGGLATNAAPSSAAGGDLFGAHSSDFLYATVWVGLLVAGVYLLYTGTDRTTHGGLTRTRKHVERTAGRAAATAAVA